MNGDSRAKVVAFMCDNSAYPAWCELLRSTGCAEQQGPEAGGGTEMTKPAEIEREADGEREDRISAGAAAPGSVSGLSVVRVPCAGRVEELHVLQALEQGADGVLVLGCFEDSCRYIRGNLRAEARLERVGGMLEDLELGAERVHFAPLAANSQDRLLEIIEDFWASLDELIANQANPAGKEAVRR